MAVDSVVVVHEETFPGSGITLFRRSVLPAGDAWARLALLHGYGDHSGRYGHFMRWMAERGVACHVLDFRGHGLAGGRRGFVHDWYEYLDDLSVFLALGAVGGDAPLFLQGQSHGGLVLAAAGIRGLSGVAGCILSAPYLRSKLVAPRSKLLLAYAANHLLPWLPVTSGVPKDWLTSDAAMREEDDRDTLVLSIATPRWYVRMLAVQTAVLRQAPEFRLPLLVLMGEADRIADPSAAREFHERAGSADKTFRPYPDHLHDLLRESGREEIFAQILHWMRERTPTGATPA